MNDLSKTIKYMTGEKMTPSNCRKKGCSWNVLPPGENSQECIACEGNKDKNWRPERPSH